MDFTVLIILAICGFVFGIIGLCVALIAVVKVIAMEKSTHSIQYMPVDPQIDKENQAFIDQWATSDESLEKQNKLFRKDLEEEMPEFALDEEDRKRFSF